jgi:hypothetical protein
VFFGRSRDPPVSKKYRCPFRKSQADGGGGGGGRGGRGGGGLGLDAMASVISPISTILRRLGPVLCTCIAQLPWLGSAFLVLRRAHAANLCDGVARVSPSDAVNTFSASANCASNSI